MEVSEVPVPVTPAADHSSPLFEEEVAEKPVHPGIPVGNYPSHPVEEDTEHAPELTAFPAVDYPCGPVGECDAKEVPEILAMLDVEDHPVEEKGDEGDGTKTTAMSAVVCPYSCRTSSLISRTWSNLSQVGGRI